MSPPDGTRFLALLHEHRAILYKVAFGYCRNREDRVDLVQEMNPAVALVRPLRQPREVLDVGLAMWLSHRCGERLSRSSIVRHIADSITGRDIAAAREYLEKLRRFGSDAD